jgi:hypothetical protein
MADIDEVLKRLAEDEDFKKQLAVDPAATLAPYDLSEADLDHEELVGATGSRARLTLDNKPVDLGMKEQGEKADIARTVSGDEDLRSKVELLRDDVAYKYDLGREGVASKFDRMEALQQKVEGLGPDALQQKVEGLDPDATGFKIEGFAPDVDSVAGIEEDPVEDAVEDTVEDKVEWDAPSDEAEAMQDLQPGAEPVPGDVPEQFPEGE